MDSEFVEVVINRAIHGTFCSIDKRKLDEANSTGRKLKVTIVGVGTAIVSPEVWWNTAVRKEKRVVNYANRPMTFVYNFLDLPSKFKANKDLCENQLQLI